MSSTYHLHMGTELPEIRVHDHRSADVEYPSETVAVQVNVGPGTNSTTFYRNIEQVRLHRARLDQALNIFLTRQEAEARVIAREEATNG